jgi:transcriptional regulator with XRE-family HTH domain
MNPSELRAWRQEHGLTQAQLSELLDVSQATLEGIEQGRRPGSALLGPIGVLLRTWDAIGVPALNRAA